MSEQHRYYADNLMIRESDPQKSITFEDERQISEFKTIIELPKLPESMNGFKIAYLTDLHTSWRNLRELSEMIQRINAENVDLVVLGGDYVSDFGKVFDQNLSRLGRLIGKIKSKGGILAVLGNHDVSLNKVEARFNPQKTEKIIAELEKQHVRIIENEKVAISNQETPSDYFYIHGIPDSWQTESGQGQFLPDWKKISGSNQPEKLTVGVYHNPIAFLDYSNKLGFPHADLVLAGHTHGGKELFNFQKRALQYAKAKNITTMSARRGKRYYPAYTMDQGLYQLGESQLYVSQGASSSWKRRSSIGNCLAYDLIILQKSNEEKTKKAFQPIISAEEKKEIIEKIKRSFIRGKIATFFIGRQKKE